MQMFVEFFIEFFLPPYGQVFSLKINEYGGNGTAAAPALFDRRHSFLILFWHGHKEDDPQFFLSLYNNEVFRQGLIYGIAGLHFFLLYLHSGQDQRGKHGAFIPGRERKPHMEASLHIFIT